MKRFILAALAALGMAAPLTSPGAAFADPRGQRGHNPHAQGRHDNGLHRGWDRHRFNGYQYRGVWRFGPPPVSLGERIEFGYRPWRRGDRLPDYYRNSLDVVDYRVLRLAPPPRGYHYVRDDRGDYLLVGANTGLILGVALAH